MNTFHQLLIMSVNVSKFSEIYSYNVLLPQQLLPAVSQLSGKFIFQQATLCLKKRDPDVIDCNFEKY